MSETDDRMERANRIREMRERREPSDDDASEADDASTGDDTSAADDGAAEDTPSTADDSSARTDQGASATETTAEASVDTETTPDEAGTGEEATTAEASADAASAVDAAADTAGTQTGGGVAPLGGGGDFSLPDSQDLETDDSDAPSEGETGAVARSRGSVATSEPSVRVLEFTVGEQVYCIDIDSVEEIVKREAVTRVPNTAKYVEGVVDLRGQITTILDTKRLLDVDESGRESLLVVFAPDAFEEHGTVGWVVDEVRQVVPVMDSQVRRPPEEAEHVRGVVDREDAEELVVWIKPGRAMSGAIDDRDEE